MWKQSTARSLTAWILFFKYIVHRANNLDYFDGSHYSQWAKIRKKYLQFSEFALLALKSRNQRFLKCFPMKLLQRVRGLVEWRIFFKTLILAFMQPTVYKKIYSTIFPFLSHYVTSNSFDMICDWWLELIWAKVIIIFFSSNNNMHSCDLEF